MSDIDDLKQLEEAWVAAVEGSDRDAAEAIVGDDFVLTSSGGVGPWVSRDEWFDNLERIHTSAFGISNVEARVFDDVGVVRLLGHWEARLAERDLTGEYAIVDVWTRREGSWQVSWRVSQRLP